MALEAVTFLGDLVATNPAGGDSKADGDDHIRNTKKGLKASFAGFTGAILVTGTDGGVVDAYTLTPSYPLPAYSTKMLVVFSPTVSNTGAVTLNISGLGAKAVVSVGGVAMVAGDLTAGRYYTAFYDGTKFRLDNVTQNYVDQVVTAGSVPGVNDAANAGKVFSSTGAVGQWVSLDGRGAPALDKGDSGVVTQTISYAGGEGQTVKATGSHILSADAASFPAGRMSGVLLRLIGYGSYPGVTTTGITWIKADGTQTTNFATAGITFASGTGESFVAVFSYGDGKVYGKVAR